jgi:hypothetical protein
VDKVVRAYKIVLPIANGSHQEITGNCIVKGWAAERSDRRPHDRDPDGSLHRLA